MTFIAKNRWNIIRDFILGWTLAFIFLCIVRGVGTYEQGSVQFEFWTSILLSVLLGLVFGSISGVVQIIIEKSYRHISIQKLICFRSLFALGFLSLLIVTNYLICRQFFGLTIGIIEFAFEPGSFAIYFYILFIDFFLVMMRHVKLMIGDRNLSKLLKGQFYTPREEERIFMFLDLQGSTQLAEKLGHVQYSKLIQDCFNDLAVVAENEAEIYQYVGDEVILTWKLKAGLRNDNCIKAYLNFRQVLMNRQEYYQAKYSCMPFFKAGMNAGKVVVTEVGRYKREIAYHGDTINTAARIQGKCNELGQELLLSSELKEKLNETSYEFNELGLIDLKGKEKKVPIFTLSQPLSLAI